MPFKLLKWTVTAIAVAAFSNQSYAESAADNHQDIKEKLAATYTNMSVSTIQESPIPGLFEIHTGSGIIYYHGDTKLLILGEIYNEEGISLTSQSQMSRINERLNSIDLSLGVTVGNTEGSSIIEFTSPTCGYCINYHSFIEEKAAEYSFNRTLFFITSSGSEAEMKASHIICSEDKDQALVEVYEHKAQSFKVCSEAKKILKEHRDIANSLGIGGTPTFILDGKVEVGFRPGVITSYLENGNFKKE